MSKYLVRVKTATGGMVDYGDVENLEDVVIWLNRNNLHEAAARVNTAWQMATDLKDAIERNALAEIVETHIEA